MKKIATSIIALALCAVVAAPALAANTVRISQVYGGGGGSTGTYLQDYVELFNASGSPVAIGGWAIEYGSATGLWGSSASNIAILPAGATIPACGYYLVQCGTTGTNGVALPVTPDFNQASGPNISATSGKVALFSVVNSNVACGAEVSLVDKVSFGSANCPEVTNVGTLSSSQTAVRNGAGMIDTDSNVADFTIALANAVTIHNSLSIANPACVATPASTQTWGRIKTIYR